MGGEHTQWPLDFKSPPAKIIWPAQTAPAAVAKTFALFA
jgi:hypothetical protein